MKVICPNSEKCGYDCVHREYHDEHNDCLRDNDVCPKCISIKDIRKEKLKKLQNG